MDREGKEQREDGGVMHMHPLFLFTLYFCPEEERSGGPSPAAHFTIIASVCMPRMSVSRRVAASLLDTDTCLKLTDEIEVSLSIEI